MTLVLALMGCRKELNLAPITEHPTSGFYGRLYAARVPDVGFMAVHVWIVTQTPDGDSHRWEVMPVPRDPYGVIRYNWREPEAWPANKRGSWVIRELAEPEAQRLHTFLWDNITTYPCRGTYTLYPGPNSNTFIHWALKGAGLDTQLPWRAIGQRVRCRVEPE